MRFLVSEVPLYPTLPYNTRPDPYLPYAGRGDKGSSLSLSHSRSLSLTHTHSLTLSLSRSDWRGGATKVFFLPLSLSHSLTHSLTRSLAHALTLTLSRSLTGGEGRRRCSAAPRARPAAFQGAGCRVQTGRSLTARITSPASTDPSRFAGDLRVWGCGCECVCACVCV